MAYDTQATRPLISVVMPCYAQAHFLPDEIESVIGQCYSPTEVIVVDDGSPDNVDAVVARYAGVRSVKQENKGVATARNTGIEQTSGSLRGVFPSTTTTIWFFNIDCMARARRNAGLKFSQVQGRGKTRRQPR
jgi:glycosyltransferase involved in cell wall biosynthesis